MFKLDRHNTSYIFNYNSNNTLPHSIFKFNFTNTLEIDSFIQNFKFLTLYELVFDDILSNKNLNYTYTLIENTNHYFLSTLNLNYDNDSYFYLRNFRDKLKSVNNLIVTNLDNYKLELNISNIVNYNQIKMLLDSNLILEIYLKDNSMEYMVTKEYLENYQFNNNSIKIIYLISFDNPFIKTVNRYKCLFLKLNNITVNNINNITYGGKVYKAINFDMLKKGSFLLSNKMALLVL